MLHATMMSTVLPSSETKSSTVSVQEVSMSITRLKEPGTFVSWHEVILGFKRTHGGVDPMLNIPDGWLSLAARESERGRPTQADVYLEAGLVREAYDRDTYEPPLELQHKFGRKTS